MLPRLLRFALLLTALFPCAFALAQSYPTKPIRVIIPYAPGGGIDRMGRILAPLLGSTLGQPVVIENQGGAATMIGTSMVARAPADGHTLLLTTNGFSVNVLVQKAPSYKVEEFVAVAPLAVFGYVLAANPNLPARNVAELVAYAKSNPTKVNAATVGQGSALHLLGERLDALAGTSIPDIHYRGLGPALTDVMAGQVQLIFDTIGTSARQVKAGKVRALAVTSPDRSPLLPDVPTFREAGYPGMTQLGWQGVFAPAATPVAIVEKLNREIVAIAASPKIRAQFEPEGLTPMDLSREEFAKFVREDAQPWERIVKALNIKVEE